MVSHQLSAISCQPKQFLLLLIAESCVLIALSGCAYAPVRTPIQGPVPLPAEVAAYYDYPDHTPEATVEPVRGRATYHEFFVRFPLSASGFEPTEPEVEFEWFESTAPGRRAAILFNPILGGDYPLERSICRFLARNGFHVALVHRNTLKISPEHTLDRIELLLRQGIVRIRQIVDWMAAHERVDPDRMGSFWISMGAIASVITAAVEPRLKVHVAALGSRRRHPRRQQEGPHRAAACRSRASSNGQSSSSPVAVSRSTGTRSP